MSEHEEKVSRAIDSYLSRTGRMTTHTSADWLIEDLEAEGLIIVSLGEQKIPEGKREKLEEFLSEEAERFITNESPKGCWCVGFDHRFECRHNPMNRKKKSAGES